MTTRKPERRRTPSIDKPSEDRQTAAMTLWGSVYRYSIGAYRKLRLPAATGRLTIGFWAVVFILSGSLVAQSPNVVLIISDDQAWSDYGFMGHELVRTPHLDRLAKESVLFRRGYVPTALCRPSLMSLATGQYAHRHGITGNDPSPKYAKGEEYQERREQLIAKLDTFDTLPELLGERGFLSHQSGKWWEGNYARGGFTHGMTRGFPQRGGRHGDDGLTIGRQGMAPIDEFVKLAKDQGKPFFLWYAPFLPHTPHNPPERFLARYRDRVESLHVARYYAMCEWFDESCGQLLAIIDRHGFRENTVIVYVTDNGWIQNPDRRGYGPRSKQTPYEGGVRTPIMFRWPGKLRPADRPDLVSSIDLMPTILAATGARVPENLPGLNLLSHMETGSALPRERLFGEGFSHDIADLDRPEASLLYRWTIEGRWKLLLTYDGEVNRYQSTHPRTVKAPQLFDLIKDPWERRNLAFEHPDRVYRMAEYIAAWYPVRERRVQTSVEPAKDRP